MTNDENNRLTKLEVQTAICLDAMQALTMFWEKSAFSRKALREAEATISFICGAGR